jgi:hydroxymethylpyrimidine pyrophosphatase-like HAD family hydrolase
VAAIGDAENDAAMLNFARVGVAVADAVPLLQQRADLITQGGAGFSIVELTDLILRDQLKLSAV